MSFKSSFTTPAVAAISLCLIGGTSTAAAEVLHVPGDYLTIQAAIDAAVNGDEIVVADGIYIGPGNRDLDFGGREIHLRSESLDPTRCIIDCQASKADPHRGFYFHSGETSEAVVEGFTIRNGYVIHTSPGGARGGGTYCRSSSPQIIGCIFTTNTAVLEGGAVYNEAGDLSLGDCTFTDNFAFTAGGAVFVLGGAPALDGCTFISNSVGFFFAEFSFGGALRIVDSNPLLVDCLFSGNSGIAGSLAVGGAIANTASSPTLVRCMFVGNQVVTACSGGRGGAMNNDSGSDPILAQCTFAGNYSNGEAGAMDNDDSSPLITNCLFVGNMGGHGVGAMHNAIDSNTVMLNCTFVNNIGLVFGAIENYDANPILINCILWENGRVEIGGPGDPKVSYSNIAGGWPGTGNIDVYPMFVDPDGGDYRLLSGSPSIDAGNNWGVPSDENDYDEDGVLCELFPVDLDGNPRFNADEADFDPGCGVPVVVDMGAYEYQFDPTDQVTFADLNADGSVSAADVLGLLASWGPCGKGCCLADLDIDGTVGASDLLALLANWGPCQ